MESKRVGITVIKVYYFHCVIEMSVCDFELTVNCLTNYPVVR